MAIQRALISVSDKTGLEEFAKGLHEFGVELISTGGTAAFLKGLGLPVIELSDYTGEPELFEDASSHGARGPAAPPRQ